MNIIFSKRWLLVVLLYVSTCLLLANARGGGRGGGGRGGSRGGGFRFSRPSYSRPAPAPAYRPPPAPVYRPPPAPVYRLPPAPAYRPPVYKPPPAPVVVKSPASSSNFKRTDLTQGSANKQPAYNPNYKPDAPAGPPPPYSPSGHLVPNAPAGPPPAYRPNAPFGNPPAGVQPPPYPGPPVRPPAYPVQSAPYPVQPSGAQPPPFNQPAVNRQYPVQPGFHQQQPGINRPYPVQPGVIYPQTGGSNRPYPVQPGVNYPSAGGSNRPYPVQPGVNYPNAGGSNRPYPQQPLGGNVWQPHHTALAPAYMNYGGIPTGANMHAKHKKKGFIGSLMSAGKPKSSKQNKYIGSYPSPYGVGGMGHTGGGFLGKHGKSAAMYTILPYMAAKKAPKLFKPRFGFMPIYMPRPYYHHHYYHHHRHGSVELDGDNAKYFDIYKDDYVGKCQQPIKIENGEVKCNASSKEVQCDARCDTGYRFPHKIEMISNKCWHVTGIWRPQKNFPKCQAVCENECMNGGDCFRPGVCKCSSGFRGSRCQFHYLECDIRKLIKEEKVGWTCAHTRNETKCKISCKEPGQFESTPSDEYKCSAEGVWTPDTIPHCVISEKRALESIFLNK